MSFEGLLIMVRSIVERFSRHLGIDLGTTNTLICDRETGLLINEPSVIAFDVAKGKVIAAGSAASQMTGRCPTGIEALYPLRDGVINHFELAASMLSLFLKRARKQLNLCGSRIVICVPTETTKVERRAFRDVVLAVGARSVCVLEEPMAAAIGAGLPIAEPRGSMIVDVGGGTTEIAVFSLCGVVCSGSVRIGGQHLDNAITFNLRRRRNFLIGAETAETLKIQLGSADDSVRDTLPVKGKDLIRQVPGILNVEAEEVFQAIEPPVSRIVQAVRSTFERIPPELSADVSDKGLVLAGGGGLLRGLDRVIQKETGVRTVLTEQPLLSVVQGTTRVLADEHLLHKVGVLVL
jgi:rod shape-determining protein MreB